MSRNALVIWNGNAGSAGAAEQLRQQLQGRNEMDVRVTSSCEESVGLAADEALPSDLIIAAGGDGTINAVINGMMKRSQAPPLAILPIGTGNNLCRSLNVPLDLDGAMRLIDEPRVRQIDLVQAISDENTLYFANVASGGNSERVIEQLTDEIKQTWGPWCYLRNAIPVITDLRGYEISLQLDDHAPEEYSVWNIMVANAPTAAAGLPVAPGAKIDDGLLDVIVVLDGTPLDTTRLAAEFFLGNYLEDDRVIYRRARRVGLSATPRIGFLADGESLTGQNYRFEIIPAALDIVAPHSTRRPGLLQ